MMSVSRRVWWGAGLAVVVLLGWGGWTVWRASGVWDREQAMVAEGNNLRLRRQVVQAVAGEVWVPADDFLDAAVWEGGVWAISSAAVIGFDGEGRETKRLRVGLELPAAPITSMAVASLGASDRPSLWIGTRGAGLLKYDGRVLEQIEPEEPKRAKVRALLALPAGRLAIGTERGLLVYDGSVLTTLHDAVGKVAVSALAGRDRVWVGTSDAGLYAVSGGTAQRVTGLPDEQVLSVAGNDSQAWVGLAAGVAQVSGSAMERMILPGSTALAIDQREGSLEIGGVEGGLSRVTLSGERRRVVSEEGLGLAVVHAVHTLGTSATAQTLVAAKGGVWLRAAGTWSRFGSAKDGTLGNGNVSAVMRDRSGRLWVGYFDEGLQVFSSTGQPLLRVNDERVFCVNAVWQAAEDSRVWVATANGLAEFDGQVQLRRWMTKKEGLLASHVTSMAGDRERWVAGTPAGLNMQSREGLTGLYVLHGLPNNHVYAVAARGSQVLVGTLGGLALLDGGRVMGTWTTANSGLRANWITAVVAWGDGWMVGTYGGGVYRLTRDGQLIREEGVPGDLIVNPLAMAASQRLVWVGSMGRGLFRYDGKEERWTRVTRGLGSLTVTAVYDDGRTLYAGTDNGLSLLRE